MFYVRNDDLLESDFGICAFRSAFLDKAEIGGANDCSFWLVLFILGELEDGG